MESQQHKQTKKDLEKILNFYSSRTEPAILEDIADFLSRWSANFAKKAKAPKKSK